MARSVMSAEERCELIGVGVNLIGIVWTVDQDTHNTVTVEFYDREQYRGYHFLDPFLYDKACLSNLPS
jgi:chromosome transmission fidelity protein 4